MSNTMDVNRLTRGKKVTWYDPPSGWKYGFPKVYEPSSPDEPLDRTLVADGYPKRDADFGAKHTRFWEDEE